MTTTNQIGFITLTYPSFTDGREYTYNTDIQVRTYEGVTVINPGISYESPETFSVLVDAYQFHQLKNLRLNKEMVWINLAPDLTFYHQIPQGLYLLGDVKEEEFITHDKRILSITAYQITNDPNELLQYSYTTGEDDQTILETDYPIATTVTTKWDENFSSWDTTNEWYGNTTNGITDSSITSSGGKAKFTGKATTNSKLGRVLAPSKYTFNLPSYVEFDLERSALPTTYAYSMDMLLMNKRILSGNVFPYNSTYNFLRISHTAYPTYSQLVVYKHLKGKWTTLYTENLGASQTSVNIRLLITASNELTIWRDLGAGAGFTEIITSHKTGMTLRPLWITPGFHISENVAKDGYIDNLKVYTVNRGGTATFPNLIAGPIGTYSLTPTHTRDSEDGNIPYFASPNYTINYNVNMATDMYKGAVKVYNKLTGEDTYRQTVARDEIFTVAGFKATNGLIQLKLTSTGVEFYYWNGTAYALLNTFVTGTITTVKLREYTSERAVIQINRTYWVIQRGKKQVLVYHENTDLGYTAKDFYYHDDGTGTMAEEDLTSAGADADVDMDDWYYCNIYDTTGEDAYNLQIIKTWPQTIKNDSIPADEKTVLGYYKKGDTGYDSSLNLALEAHVWPICHIMLESP